MAVNIKLGVDYAGFKQGMREAQASVNTLDAALKKNEAQFKATGDAEQYMSQKSEILRQKMQSQKAVVENAARALAEMNKKEIPQTSTEYQKLSQQLLNAEAAMLETQSALDNLSNSQQNAASSADQLVQSMNSIGKKVSLEQVIGGINTITSGLEHAARTAVQLGEKLFEVIMDAAAQADDISTMATRLGLTEEEVQQINYNAARFEVTAEQLGTTWKKVKNNMTSDSEEIVEGFKKIGVKTHQDHDLFGILKTSRDYKDVFWETGEALLKMTDAAEQERLATKLLGRSWDELKVLFGEGREAYEAALAAAPVASEEAVDNLASLNDRMAELESSWNTLKLEALGAIAPALEKGADAIANLLDKITEYLKTDEGQELLNNLGKAVENLFNDLSNIDPDKVVENFAKLFEGVVSSFQWLEENWENVKAALIGIAAGFGVLKIATFALNITKLVSGLNGLVGGGGGGGTGADAGGTGTASGGGTGGVWLSNIATTLVGSLQTRAMVEEVERAAKIWSAIDKSGSNVEIAKQFHEVSGVGGSYAESDKKLAEFIDNITDSGDPGSVNLNGIEIRVKPVVDDEDKEVDLDAHFVVSDVEDEEILKQLGIINIPARISIVGMTGGGTGFTLDGITQLKYANGIPWIENDNTLALLHRGERVLTASENRHYTYNSNNYFGNVNLNNGQDIEALCDSIDRHNRRQGAGYGS